MTNNKPADEPSDDLDVVRLSYGGADWHSGPGWYAVIVDYPDEGSHFFGGQRPTATELLEHSMREEQ